MSITQSRARQIIKEEVARALRNRNLSENYGGMEDEAVYEFDEMALDDGYAMDDEGMMDEEDMMDVDDMMEYDMEEGQHDNDMGGQHDNDLGAGDDALMETLRRRLLGRKARR